AADGGVQRRALVVEVGRRDDREARGGELRPLQQRHAGRVVVDRARVLGRRRLAGEGAAKAAGALLEEREAGRGRVVRGGGEEDDGDRSISPPPPPGGSTGACHSTFPPARSARASPPSTGRVPIQTENSASAKSFPSIVPASWPSPATTVPRPGIQ